MAKLRKPIRNMIVCMCVWWDVWILILITQQKNLNKFFNIKFEVTQKRPLEQSQPFPPITWYLPSYIVTKTQHYDDNDVCWPFSHVCCCCSESWVVFVVWILARIVTTMINEVLTNIIDCADREIVCLPLNKL